MPAEKTMDNETTTDAGSSPVERPVRPLRERLHNHLAVMQQKQREQLTGSLLFEATEEIDRLHEWADGFSDAQLKERAACETTLRAATERLRAFEAGLADIAMMLKRCAWALRRGTAPELGERALELLKEKNLLGSPLRDETLEEAGAAAAALYDRWTGKA